MRFILACVTVALLGVDVQAQCCSAAQSPRRVLRPARLAVRTVQVATAVAVAPFAGPTITPAFAGQRTHRFFGRLRGRCG